MKQDIEILQASNTGDIIKDAQNIIEQTPITHTKPLMLLWYSAIGYWVSALLMKNCKARIEPSMKRNNQTTCLLPYKYVW